MPKGKIRVCAQSMLWQKAEPDFSFDAELGIECFDCVLRQSGKGADFEVNKIGKRKMRSLALPLLKLHKFSVSHMISGCFDISADEAKIMLDSAFVKKNEKMQEIKKALELKVEQAKNELYQHESSINDCLAGYAKSVMFESKIIDGHNVAKAYG